MFQLGMLLSHVHHVPVLITCTIKIINELIIVLFNFNTITSYFFIQTVSEHKLNYIYQRSNTSITHIFASETPYIAIIMLFIPGIFLIIFLIGVFSFPSLSFVVFLRAFSLWSLSTITTATYLKKIIPCTF